MSQAEELLDSLSEGETATYALTPDEEPHIIINPDKSITIPDELKEIAVQFDHDVKTVTFDCPRYWDGRDLFSMHLYINYQRPDGVKAPYPVEDLRLNDEDESIIHFDWTIEDDVTKVNGNITFLVCGKIANSEGELERHWNSKPNQDLIVVAGMDCVDAVLERYPDVIEKILADLDTSVKLVKEAVFTVNGQEPDENGNVEVEAGGIKTVNGQEPDENGNVEVTVGVQSDMYETDPESMAFVRNNPLETVETEVPLVITWDGDLTGKETSSSSENGYYAKISDIIISNIEDIINSKIVLSIFGVDNSMVVAAENVMDVSEYGMPAYIVSDNDGNAACLFVKEDFAMGEEAMSSGIWFNRIDVDGVARYPKSLTCPNATTTTTKQQLKPSLIPSHSHKWNDISDAPFYDRSVSEPLNITFDGDMSNYESAMLQEGMYMVKVSDTVLSLDQIIGSTMVATDGTNEVSLVLSSDTVMDLSVSGSDIPAFLVQYDDPDSGAPFMAYFMQRDFSEEGITLTSGVWVLYGETDGGSAWVKSISNPNVTVTTGELKKLNPKFYDRPCYDDRVTNVKSYSYDGVLDNKTTVELDMAEYLVKVSDDIIVSANSFVGASLSSSTGSEPQIITEDIIAVNDDYIALGEKTVVSVINDCVFNGVAITKGLWVYHSMMGYISSLSNVTITTGEIKKLDPKFYDRPCYESEPVLLSLENAEFHFYDGGGWAEYIG